jgi:hypothetical protein
MATTDEDKARHIANVDKYLTAVEALLDEGVNRLTIVTVVERLAGLSRQEARDIVYPMITERLAGLPVKIQNHANDKSYSALARTLEQYEKLVRK